MDIPTTLSTGQPQKILPRGLLIAAALLIAPLAPIVHADYDFNNPAYAVKNTPDTSTAEGAAQARADAAAARQQAYLDDYERRRADERERIEHQAELDRIAAEQRSTATSGTTTTWTEHEYVIDKDGNKIDFKEFMRTHPNAVDHGSYVSVPRSDGITGDSTYNAFGNTDSSSSSSGSRSHFIIAPFFLLALLISAGRWILGFFSGGGSSSTSRPLERRTRDDDYALERGAQLSAAMEGRDVPIAMRKAEAPPEPEAPREAEKPIEYVRPVYGAEAEAAAAAAPVIASAPKAAPLTGTTLWAQTQLELFAVDQSPQPILYASQVKKIDLDYSAASLERLDVFLQQLRAKTNPQLKDYNERFQHRNLLILLGLYIGTTVARLTNQPIKWYDYAGAKTLLDRKGYSESIQCAYSCMLGKTDHYMPIEVVCDILFGNDPSQTCVASLAHHQQRATP